ncbi:hypothetical protein LINGRAHAP2_LOCUS33423, partial [Linum grandiflorum]
LLYRIFSTSRKFSVTVRTLKRVIVKDSQGRVCNGVSGQVLYSSPIMAEAKALLTAVEFAEDFGLRTIIKSDCLTLILALNGRMEVWPWQCYAWLGRMRDILAR